MFNMYVPMFLNTLRTGGLPPSSCPVPPVCGNVLNCVLYLYLSLFCGQGFCPPPHINTLTDMSLRILVIWTAPLSFVLLLFKSSFWWPLGQFSSPIYHSRQREMHFKSRDEIQIFMQTSATKVTTESFIFLLWIYIKVILFKRKSVHNVWLYN